MKKTVTGMLTALTLGLVSSSLMATEADTHTAQSNDERQGVVEVMHLTEKNVHRFTTAKEQSRAMRDELSEQHRLMIDAMMHNVTLAD